MMRVKHDGDGDEDNEACMNKKSNINEICT